MMHMYYSNNESAKYLNKIFINRKQKTIFKNC